MPAGLLKLSNRNRCNYGGIDAILRMRAGVAGNSFNANRQVVRTNRSRDQAVGISPVPVKAEFRLAELSGIQKTGSTESDFFLDGEQ
jgi:hypothetical protein